MTNLVEGVDLSHWQTPGLVLPPATRFAWIKASQGDESTDKAMRRHHDELGKDGIARGPYHFYECNDSPEGNATRFLAATAGLHWELPHALDYENASGGYGSKTSNAAKLLKFLRIVEEGTGRIPVVYTGKSWWDPMVAPDPAFTRHPVWVARYPKPNDGTLPPAGKWAAAPAPWPATTVWQYSDTSGRLDRNICSQASFAMLTGTATKPAPTPTGDDLVSAEATAIRHELAAAEKRQQARTDFVFKAAADADKALTKRLELLRDATLLGLAGGKVDVAELAADFEQLGADVAANKAALDKIAKG